MTPAVEVMIPMRDRHGLTRNLCRQLAESAEYDRLTIYDNGSTDPKAKKWLATIEETGRYGAEVVRWGDRFGIYAMWNDALLRTFLRWRQEWERPRFLAILNNDLEIPEGFLGHLAAALAESAPEVWVTYPDWRLGWPSDSTPTGELRPTTGTRNAGGMSGYAFMVDVAAFEELDLPLIDEGYLWHCGDGELVTNIEHRGGTAACVVGLPIGHVERASWKGNPRIEAIARADHARSRAKRARR